MANIYIIAEHPASSVYEATSSHPVQLNDFDGKFKIQSVDAAGFDKYHKCEIAKTRIIHRVFLRNLLYIMYYILSIIYYLLNILILINR